MISEVSRTLVCYTSYSQLALVSGLVPQAVYPKLATAGSAGRLKNNGAWLPTFLLEDVIGKALFKAMTSILRGGKFVIGCVVLWGMEVLSRGP